MLSSGLNLNSIEPALSGTLDAMQGEAHARSLDAIAYRLVISREALGYRTQVALCRATGIATNTYNQWEMAKGRPDLDLAIQLCDKTGLTLDWIYRAALDTLRGDLMLKVQAALSADEEGRKKGRA